MLDYYPILAIPAKGIIRLGRSVIIDPIVKNKKAIIERISVGGVAIIPHDKFLPEVIDNGTLQYELDTDWGIYLKQAGDLKPQTYNFTLSFDIEYHLPAGSLQTVNFKLTSKTKERIRTGTVIQEPILPLKIMWGCLAESTVITLSDGQCKPINALCIGDRVLSGINKKFATVSNIWKGAEDKLFLMTAEDGSQLEATASHPLYVRSENPIKLKRVKDINANDCIATSSQQGIAWHRVELIQPLTCSSTVYNLSLDNDEGFYANGILVGDMNAQNAEDI